MRFSVASKLQFVPPSQAIETIMCHEAQDGFLYLRWLKFLFYLYCPYGGPIGCVAHENVFIIRWSSKLTKYQCLCLYIVDPGNNEKINKSVAAHTPFKALPYYIKPRNFHTSQATSTAAIIVVGHIAHSAEQDECCMSK